MVWVWACESIRRSGLGMGRMSMGCMPRAPTGVFAWRSPDFVPRCRSHYHRSADRRVGTSPQSSGLEPSQPLGQNGDGNTIAVQTDRRTHIAGACLLLQQPLVAAKNSLAPSGFILLGRLLLVELLWDGGTKMSAISL